MKNYDRIQQATVTRLRAFDSVATEEEVRERLRKVENSASLYRSRYAHDSSADVSSKCHRSEAPVAIDNVCRTTPTPSYAMSSVFTAHTNEEPA